MEKINEMEEPIEQLSILINEIKRTNFLPVNGNLIENTKIILVNIENFYSQIYSDKFWNECKRIVVQITNLINNEEIKNQKEIERNIKYSISFAFKEELLNLLVLLLETIKNNKILSQDGYDRRIYNTYEQLNKKLSNMNSSVEKELKEIQNLKLKYEEMGNKSTKTFEEILHNTFQIGEKIRKEAFEVLGIKNSTELSKVFHDEEKKHHYFAIVWMGLFIVVLSLYYYFVVSKIEIKEYLEIAGYTVKNLPVVFLLLFIFSRYKMNRNLQMEYRHRANIAATMATYSKLVTEEKTFYENSISKIYEKINLDKHDMLNKNDLFNIMKHVPCEIALGNEGITIKSQTKTDEKVDDKK